MSETKIFRKKDLDLEPVKGMKTIGLVNVSFSDKYWEPGLVFLKIAQYLGI